METTHTLTVFGKGVPIWVGRPMLGRDPAPFICAVLSREIMLDGVPISSALAVADTEEQALEQIEFELVRAVRNGCTTRDFFNGTGTCGTRIVAKHGVAQVFVV